MKLTRLQRWGLLGYALVALAVVSNPMFVSAEEVGGGWQEEPICSCGTSGEPCYRYYGCDMPFVTSRAGICGGVSVTCWIGGNFYSHPCNGFDPCGGGGGVE